MACDHAELSRNVDRMASRLAHRGPDDSGIWVDAQAGIALGFRRLAIIDLSQHGHQPMHSASGRYTIVYNGEVYNHRELRHALESAGHRFRGHSDTEVVLAAFEEWGVDQGIARFVGMFGLAVWDADRRTLTLVRDRLGIKPLFIYARPGWVTFGSELKALHAGPCFDRSVDPEALTEYLRYLYVPAPKSIYRHVRKLSPGHILTITDPARPLPASRPYWSLEEVAARGISEQLNASDTEAVTKLETLLRHAVACRMHADVPLGALLSGGIDSSTVAALMQASSPRPVNTFSIAFEEEEFNEGPHAARVAAHLGTNHTELSVTGQDALAEVPRLADLFDEPFADPSQIPTFLVCRLARGEVTVALSGDGGDEILAGYNRYAYGERAIERLRHVPEPVRRLVAVGIGSLSPESWAHMHERLRPILPHGLHHRRPGDKLHKLGTLMSRKSEAHMYRALLSAWQRPERLVVNGADTQDRIDTILSGKDWPSLLDRMMLADQVTYLPDDLLAKVDRASMAVNLEVRVPLLDHRVVEFVWQLPRSLKVRNGTGKWLLRQVLHRYVPAEIVERPKMGFSVPIDAWLRGPLREWAEELLRQDCLRRSELLRPDPIRRAWEAFQAGRGNAGLGLWAVLMFQAWSERWQNR